jgi:hypothetical protein
MIKQSDVIRNVMRHNDRERMYSKEYCRSLRPNSHAISDPISDVIAPADISYTYYQCFGGIGNC